MTNVCVRCGKPLTLKQVRERVFLLKRRHREGHPNPTFGPCCSRTCSSREITEAIKERTSRRYLGMKVT